jgi:hypothetical protein
MANYTYQQHAESGSWAHPQGDDVRHASSLDQLNGALIDWADTVGLYDDEHCASIMVWRGVHDNITDLHPDFILRLGPRGGVLRELC